MHRVKPRKMTKINETQKLEIIKLYVVGNLSQKEIGKMYGVSGQLVSKILRNKGCETNRGGWREKKSAIEERHRKILRLHASGNSLHKIAAKMEMTASGIKYVVDKYSNK